MVLFEISWPKSRLMVYALAVEPSVTIIFPVGGAVLDVMVQSKVEYEVVPGQRGDHYYADGEETAPARTPGFMCDGALG